MRLFKKEGKRFSNNLDPSFVADNKLLQKTVKPFLLNKGNYEPQIKLIQKDKLLQDDDQIANKLKDFFLRMRCLYGIIILPLNNEVGGESD